MKPLSREVLIPMNMEYLIEDGIYCGWSTDFPGVVVQGKSLVEIKREFVKSVQIVSKYLYDENESKIRKRD
jgi:predicted RNase H-like HicB family nuclease